MTTTLALLLNFFSVVLVTDVEINGEAEDVDRAVTAEGHRRETRLEILTELRYVP